MIEFIHAVLPYFSHSPFFDVTSNNAFITNQATYNPNMFHLIQTREAFEGHLRTMQGLEYMVTQDPSNNGSKADHSGVWIIQKRQRRKRPGSDDELVGISSYFLVGENIYMAPSVANVLGTRMVCCITWSEPYRVYSPILVVRCRFSYQDVFLGIWTATVHTFYGPYVLSPTVEKSDVWSQFTSNPGQQGDYADAGYTGN